MRKLKLTTCGESLCLEIPTAFVEQYGLVIGDYLYAVETSDGVLLTRPGTDLARQLGVAEDVMERRRHVLRRLGRE